MVGKEVWRQRKATPQPRGAADQRLAQQVAARVPFVQLPSSVPAPLGLEACFCLRLASLPGPVSKDLNWHPTLQNRKEPGPFGQ